MCNVMVSYFKRNQKAQRNERQIRSEEYDLIRSEQADHSMSGEIRVDQIRDGSIILEHIELRRTVILEQSGVKASGEKRGRLERSENITGIEKSLAKIENKIVVKRSERRVRKIVWSRAEKEV